MKSTSRPLIVGLMAAGAAACLAFALTMPASGQPAPIKISPKIKDLQSTVTCPATAKVTNSEPAPAGWSVMFGAFGLPLYSASVVSNDASTDYLKCSYGAAGNQFALNKTVKKGTCTVNEAKTGFTCK